MGPPKGRVKNSKSELTNECSATSFIKNTEADELAAHLMGAKMSYGRFTNRLKAYRVSAEFTPLPLIEEKKEDRGVDTMSKVMLESGAGESSSQVNYDVDITPPLERKRPILPWGDPYHWDGLDTNRTGRLLEREPLHYRPIALTERGTSAIFPTLKCYLLAFLLPLYRYNRGSLEMYTPSAIMETYNVISHNLSLFWFYFENFIRRVFNDREDARDVISCAMDVVLIVYAAGFLILSLYQSPLSS